MFAIQPKLCVVSDINDELMNCYKRIAKNPRRISQILRRYAQKNSRRFFNNIRAMSHDGIGEDTRAARFIYLNKAAFNGIYRVNKSGQFNVPYGPGLRGLSIPTENNLVIAAKILKQATILSGDFEATVEPARRGDFIYLDPPYPPRSETAFFTHYSKDKFTWNDQVKVAKVFNRLSKRGCFVMLSNSDQRRLTHLYKGFNISRLKALRWLGSNGDRFRVNEIVVTNYCPRELGLPQ